MHIYIVAIIIAVVLIAILFFALRSTVKRIDYNTKKYFIDKLQDYDYLIDEKQKLLKELEEKIEKNKKLLEENNIEKTNNVKIEKQEYYNDLNVPKYMDENLFKKYKKIRNKFSFDEEEIINKFVSGIKEKSNFDYVTLINLKKKFTSEKIFEIMKLRPRAQKEYLNTFLNKSELNFLQKYIDLENIKINKITTEINLLLEKNDPVIYVYTGEKNKSYNYISSMIKTKYDESINEGIKISYKGIIYDYSL